MKPLEGHNTHVPVLGSLRAIAALSVCLFHFICTVIGFTSNETIVSIFSYGHYGVQMFFVISGFIIPWSMYHGKYNIKHFFVFTAKRLVRLEPPYIVSLFFAIVLTYARTLSPHFNGIDTIPTVKQVILHFGYLIPFFEGQHWIRSVYWTLAIEFQYYLLIGLFFPLISNSKFGIRLIVYFLFIGSPILTSSSFLPYYLPVFLLGILLFLFKTGVIKKMEFFIMSILTSLSILWFHDIPTLCFSLVTYIAILKFDYISWKIGNFLGEISYSIYLFHGLVGMTVLNYFSHTTSSSITKFVLLCFSLASTIFFSYLLFRYIEKPSKHFSSRIKYKRESKNQ
ncbi:MAG: acyltransferase [Bacteroidia bacterium]|nr:acyltransferase [Bacteroidia bacterium]